MVDFPGHIRLVADNQTRRSQESSKSGPVKATHISSGEPNSSSAESAEAKRGQDIVNLVSLENRRAAQPEDRPTLEEAEQALRDIQAGLSETDQDLGEIHSKLDRRIILGLLAPLVT